MPLAQVELDSAEERPTEPTDHAASVAALVAKLQVHPRDETILKELLETLESWLASEGLEPPPESESIVRSRLAEWLAHLSCAGNVLHFGWREGGVATALAGTGATVVSHLDHVARAMASAIHHGTAQIQFGTLDQAEQCAAGTADLVVVETAGLTPTVPIDRARAVLRAGGWLAVLGAPVAADLEGLVDAGRFCLDDGQIRPCATPTYATTLSLFRFAVPATHLAAQPQPQPAPRREAETKAQQPTGSALKRILERRGTPREAELELRQRAARVVQTPIPNKELIDWVGGGGPQTYHNIGLVNFHQLALYCHLQPWHRVLEPGCGCGRNARHLAAYLDPRRGAYRGFDIHTEAIDWATQNITSVHPNVRFEFADIRNSNYNPNGEFAGAEFVFPYDAESFDVVFMPSVFTHMTQDELRHYAAEIERVLKPGGLLLSWHFLLDEGSRRGIETGQAQIEFRDYDEVSMAMLPENPCAAIAFDEQWTLECYESLGLQAQAVIHGRWSGREAEGYFPAKQDRILARKPD